jgi:hypothetical protein
MAGEACSVRSFGGHESNDCQERKAIASGGEPAIFFHKRFPSPITGIGEEGTCLGHTLEVILFVCLPFFLPT